MLFFVLTPLIIIIIAHVLILPFENDLNASFQSFYQNDVPNWNGFDVCRKLFECAESVYMAVIIHIYHIYYLYEISINTDCCILTFCTGRYLNDVILSNYSYLPYLLLVWEEHQY